MKSVWVCSGFNKPQTKEDVDNCPINSCAGCASTKNLDKPCDAVEYAPVVRGKWIPISKDIARCSVCGQEIMAEDIPIMHYCNGKGCGALMSEEKG